MSNFRLDVNISEAAKVAKQHDTKDKYVFKIARSCWSPSISMALKLGQYIQRTIVPGTQSYIKITYYSLRAIYFLNSINLLIPLTLCFTVSTEYDFTQNLVKPQPASRSREV